MYDTLLLSVFPLLIMSAGIADYASLQIPNWLNGLIAASIMPFVLLSGMPVEIFAWHVAAAIVTFLVGLVLFFMRLIGGGDVKMLAACALWVGWAPLPGFLVLTLVAGGVLAMGTLAWTSVNHLMKSRQDGEPFWLRAATNTRVQLPYGLAIAAGGTMIFPATWWLEGFSRGLA